MVGKLVKMVNRVFKLLNKLLSSEMFVYWFWIAVLLNILIILHFIFKDLLVPNILSQ